MTVQSSDLAGAAPKTGVRTLLDELLTEQRQLTAAESFAEWHTGTHPSTGGQRYQSLLPATPPAPGQQYGFDVDLDKCSGCKSCVAACHSLNGLDEGEAWRSVGTLRSDDWRRPFQQTITTACHHCVDPACLNGCPVLAYEKDPGTGIVRHLDDQCIGCHYCILKCPYDVPKYSPARGIVRKCDMCSQRLAVKEAPACVQACPNAAIRISLVAMDNLKTRYRIPDDFSSRRRMNLFLPSSPDPELTLPTTLYRAKSDLAPDLIPADAVEVRLQPAHAPLIWMLIATQASIGALFFSRFLAKPSQGALCLSALIVMLFGLAASLLHLGRPLKAWRSFLGWKTSWLSREIIAFGLFLPLTLGAAVRPSGVMADFAAAFGLLAVFTSGMVYHDTRRALWLGFRSIGRFFGTTAILGTSATWFVSSALENAPLWPALSLAIFMVAKFAGENRVLRRGDSDLASEPWPKDSGFTEWSLAQSAVLMRERLGMLCRVRSLCGILGGIVVPLLSLLLGTGNIFLAGSALGLCLVGEGIERYLFFRCVVPPRMPGGEVSHG